MQEPIDRKPLWLTEPPTPLSAQNTQSGYSRPWLQEGGGVQHDLVVKAIVKEDSIRWLVQAINVSFLGKYIYDGHALQFFPHINTYIVIGMHA